MRPALALLLAAGCYNVDSLTSNTPNSGDLAVSAMEDLAGADFAGVDLAITPENDAGMPLWQALSSGVKADLRGLAADTDTLYVVGAGSTVLRITADNKVHAEDPGPNFNLRAVTTAGGDVWAVGDNGAALRRQAGVWHYSASDDAVLYSAFGLGAGDFVAVGSGGHFEHNQIEEMTGSSLALFGVFARSASDVFAAGEGGTIIHRGPDDGGAPDTSPWTALGSGTTNDLHGIHGDGTTLLAAGAAGTILRSDDGIAWTAEASGSSSDLFAVWVSDAEAYVAGNNGVVLHKKGTTWTVEHTGGPTLRAIVGRSTSDVFAVGDSGTILHRVP
jgi:hypothetical protein